MMGGHACLLFICYFHLLHLSLLDRESVLQIEVQPPLEKHAEGVMVLSSMAQKVPRTSGARRQLKPNLSTSLKQEYDTNTCNVHRNLLSEQKGWECALFDSAL